LGRHFRRFLDRTGGQMRHFALSESRQLKGNSGKKVGALATTFGKASDSAQS
jgi:hypothetical protein